MRAQKKTPQQDESNVKKEDELLEGEDYDLLDEEKEDENSKNDAKATLKTLVSSKGVVIVLVVLITGFMVYRTFFTKSEEPVEEGVVKTKDNVPFSKTEVQRTGSGSVVTKDGDKDNPFLKMAKEKKKSNQDIFEDPDLPPLEIDRDKNIAPIQDFENTVIPNSVPMPIWVDKSKEVVQYNPNNEKEYYDPKTKSVYSQDSSGKQVVKHVEEEKTIGSDSAINPAVANIEPPSIAAPDIKTITPDDQAGMDPNNPNAQVQNLSNVVDSTKLSIEEKRKISMFVVSGGGPNSSNNKRSEKKDFMIIDESAIAVRKTNDSKGDIKRLTNLDVSLLTGKILDAVLETSINTEVPGSVRAVVSYDVYGEIGDKVLIPKGSRLYGSYSSEVTRGQSRLKISWTRIVRPDGIDVTISAQASDQFGRTGIQGDVDNRLGDSIANSLLVTMTTLGAGLLAQQLGTGQGQSQIVNPNGTFTTTNITPLNYAAQAAIQTATDMISSLTEGNLKLNPVISLPQGTRIKVVIEQDVILPPFKKILVN